MGSLHLRPHERGHENFEAGGRRRLWTHVQHAREGTVEKASGARAWRPASVKLSAQTAASLLKLVRLHLDIADFAKISHNDGHE